MEIKSGNCYALFAFDVAVAIDLDRTQRIVATERAALRHKRRAPRYFDYQPAPLRVSEETAPLILGAIETRSNVDLVLYDFGAVSVAYSIPLIGPFDFLLDLSEILYDNADLLADARRRVERLLQVIAAAVDRQSIAEFVEDYVIFEIESFGEPVDVKGFYLSRAQQLAQILRAERGELSEEEVSDAISHRISFGPGDLAIIDWQPPYFLMPMGMTSGRCWNSPTSSWWRCATWTRVWIRLWVALMTASPGPTNASSRS